eukprot:gb/GEZJ01001543.1/.p1 GENE.gb/GEZJ01001543.1/~~gb/GEZJ01001543.1/.p1  ORF type:complete len:189 (+),score=4.59 gb/GEZJ01001543.1/:1495-2061(+)
MFYVDHTPFNKCRRRTTIKAMNDFRTQTIHNTFLVTLRFSQPWNCHRKNCWCFIETRENIVLLYLEPQLIKYSSGSLDHENIQYQSHYSLVDIAKLIPARHILSFAPSSTRFAERGENIVILKNTVRLNTYISFSSRNERRSWLEAVRACFLIKKAGTSLLDDIRSFRSPKFETIGNDFEFNEEFRKC